MPEPQRRTVQIDVQALKVPTIRSLAWEKLFGCFPHLFQARIANTIETMRNEQGGAIILNLPTGLGKTRALITHAFMNNASVILVYPNNALKTDQGRQINRDKDLSTKPHEVVDIDSYHLRKYMQEEGRNLQRKGSALYYHLTQGLAPFQRPKIVLTNPDIFMLLLHGLPAMSQMSLNEVLQHYPVIAFDEVHSYDVKQVCSILHAAQLLLTRKPFVFIFSSATIAQDSPFRKILSTFPRVEEEDLEKQFNVPSESIVEWRPILSPLRVEAEGVEKWEGVSGQSIT